MGRNGSLLNMARSAVVPALCVAFIGYFAYHAIIGPSGLLAWGGYTAERTELETRLAHLDGERKKLEQRARLLNPRKVDPDLADELVRKNLAVVRPDEVVIPLGCLCWSAFVPCVDICRSGRLSGA